MYLKVVKTRDGKTEVNVAAAILFCHSLYCRETRQQLTKTTLDQNKYLVNNIKWWCALLTVTISCARHPDNIPHNQVC